MYVCVCTVQLVVVTVLLIVWNMMNLECILNKSFVYMCNRN